MWFKREPKHQHHKNRPECFQAYKNKLESDKVLLSTLNELSAEYRSLRQSILSREMNYGENNPTFETKPWNKDESRKEEIKEKLGQMKGKTLDQIVYRFDLNKTREKMTAAKEGKFGEDANAYGPHNVSDEGRLNMRLGSAKALDNFIKTRTSKYEIEVMTYIKDMFPSVRSNEKIGFYHTDGFIPELNLVIECDGRYWHAGIHKLIEEDKLNAQQKHVYRYDKQKTDYVLKHNYKLIRILETDFQKHKKIGDVRSWLSTLLV